jgi:hypothetical protein
MSIVPMLPSILWGDEGAFSASEGISDCAGHDPTRIGIVDPDRLGGAGVPAVEAGCKQCKLLAINVRH